MIRRVARHTPALLIFTSLGIWSTFPLILQLDAAIPGTGAGDNVSYLWNLWWFRYALAHEGQAYLYTPMMFAPFGTQLVLHTHTTLQSALAYVLLPNASLAAAHNVVLLGGLAANGLLAYALAYYLVREVVPSLAAGVLFAGSAYVQLHLLGHFNLTHAWVIPLFALSLLHFMRRPSHLRAGVVAASAAAVTYTDYYFTIYCLALAVIAATFSASAFSLVPSRRKRPRIATALLVLLLVDAAVIAAVLVTGGTSFEVAGEKVSLRTVRNPLTIFWGLLAVWLLVRWPFRISISRRSASAPVPSVSMVVAALAVYCVLASPILFAAVRLGLSGDYVTQRVLWRSSPPGADVATLVLGHPRHIVTGRWTEAIHSSAGIGFEQVVWLGAVPFVLLIVSPRWRRAAEARLWIATAAIFFVLSLGPFLRVGGFDTALPLPWAGLRYVPVLSNARIPGRAVIMVQLAVAILTAVALSGNSRRRVTYVLATLVLLESIPAPVPLYSLPRPDAVDVALAAANHGTVVELPTGLRDGFGEMGSFDHRALVHQLAHEHQLVGGFVARLSDRVREQYDASWVLRTFVSISEPGAATSIRADAAEQASAIGIEYLILNKDGMPADTRVTRTALENAGFRFVTAEGERELYAVQKD